MIEEGEIPECPARPPLPPGPPPPPPPVEPVPPPPSAPPLSSSPLLVSAPLPEQPLTSPRHAVEGPLIRVVSVGSAAHAPHTRDGTPSPNLGQGDSDLMGSPFAHFFAVSSASGPGFAVTPSASAARLDDVVSDAGLREIMRSSSQDEIESVDPACRVAVPDAARKKRMAWGQGLKRQVSAGGTVTAQPALDAAAALMPDQDQPVVPSPDCAQASHEDCPVPGPESTASSTAPIQETVPYVPTAAVLTGPAAPKKDRSSDKSAHYSYNPQAKPSTPVDGSKPTSISKSPASMSISADVVQSHKKRAMRGVAGHLQFNSDGGGQVKRPKPSPSPSPPTATVDEGALHRVETILPPAMDICIDTETVSEATRIETKDLLLPEVGEATVTGTTPALKKTARNDGDDADDNVKRKRGRPSSSTPNSGRGGTPGSGRGSRGGGRQGRGSRRRSNESGELVDDDPGLSGATMAPLPGVVRPAFEAQSGGTLSGMNELGGGNAPIAPTNRVLLLGSNSVKLCKSHRQRLKAKQQRDPMISILSGKQDNINVFVAIHEIVRLELDSQGIDLMRLDPSQVIDPRIIQLLRNISHPSSIINLSILNCSDVAASLNLLETKGHKLYAELNAILQEMHRLQRERARLYDIHLRNLDQRQKMLAVQDALRRGISQSDVSIGISIAAVDVSAVILKMPSIVSSFQESVINGEVEGDVRFGEAEAYGFCSRTNASSTQLIMHADHPAYRSLIKNIQVDNRVIVEDATFSTNAKSAQVAYNAIIPPDYVGLLHSLSINKVRSNLVPQSCNRDLASSRDASCDRVLDSLEFKNMKDKMKANRGNVMQEVKRRKLISRLAWEYIEDQFQETQHKWKHHVSIQRKEIAEKQALLDNLTRSQAAVLSQETASLMPSPAQSIAGSLGEYAPAVPTRSLGSSTRGLRGPDASDITVGGSDGLHAGSRLNYGMRSTANSSSAGNLCGLGETSLYDHDIVMQKILQAELHQKRIATGWAAVPSLLSPWIGPKHNEPPPPNDWPHSISKLYEASDKPVAAKHLPLDVSTEKNIESEVIQTDISANVIASVNKALIEPDQNDAVSGAMNTMVDAVVTRVTDGSVSKDVADVLLTCIIDRVVQETTFVKGMAVKVKEEVPAEAHLVLSGKSDEKPVNVAEKLGNFFPDPFPAAPIFFDAHCNRLTTNGMRQLCGFWSVSQSCPAHCNCALKVDIDERRCRVWTDMEKCIFVDKFIQYPKNFPKIASFLTNRNVKDCVKFYYDSKHSFGFKALLRECQTRRRAVKCNWRQGIIAAAAAGGASYAPDGSDDKRPIYELPSDDITFLTRSAHPPNTDTLLHVPMPLLVVTDSSSEMEVENKTSPISLLPVPGSNVFFASKLPIGFEIAKTAAALASTLDGRYMRPKTASTYLRRLLDACDSGSDIEEESVDCIRNNGYLASVVKKRKFEISSTVANGLSNAARILSDVEKAVANDDSNVERIPQPGAREFGDSITSYVIDRPWRIATVCGADASCAPVKPPEPPPKVDEGACTGFHRPDNAKRKTEPGIQSPTRGRPRGVMSPRGERTGRGRGGKDRGESFDTAIMHTGEELSTRGRGRGRGRGSRGGRGRGKQLGDRPEMVNTDIAAGINQLTNFEMSQNEQNVVSDSNINSNEIPTHNPPDIKEETIIPYDEVLMRSDSGEKGGDDDVHEIDACANNDDDLESVIQGGGGVVDFDFMENAVRGSVINDLNIAEEEADEKRQSLLNHSIGPVAESVESIEKSNQESHFSDALVVNINDSSVIRKRNRILSDADSYKNPDGFEVESEPVECADIAPNSKRAKIDPSVDEIDVDLITAEEE